MSTKSISPIQYNSKCITLPEWISVLTLCLAPLIAHVFSGAPPISYLTHSRPKWYDHLCHYNPTSILWRYASIADRRIRARDWSRNDLAASNAILWTESGWDGSESIVTAAAPHCFRCPEHTHVEAFSVSMLKTIITTFQGMSALYSLIALEADFATTGWEGAIGLDKIFFPLAILGLLRLCAATWLTEDFAYVSYNEKVHSRSFPSPAINTREIPLLGSGDSLDPFLVQAQPVRTGTRFALPNSSWFSMIFRIFYILCLAGVWVIAVLQLISMPSFGLTTTAALAIVFYFFFLTVSILTYAFYFLRGRTTSTIIPCLSSAWYRLYTLAIMGFIAALIVIASIELYKWPWGGYSSGPRLGGLECGFFNDGFFLMNDFLGYLGPNSTWLADKYEGAEVVESVLGDNSSRNAYVLHNFTGFCLGQMRHLELE